MSQAVAYSVSPDLLMRDEFRVACAGRDFAEVFRLMRKWDGASQDRISSSVPGLTQTRVSKIMRGGDNIAGLGLIERLSDGLCIPGSYFGLARRPWENISSDEQMSAHSAQRGAAGSVGGVAVMTAASPTLVLGASGEVVDRCLSVEVDIAADGAATLTYRHRLHNGGSVPLSRVIRELWFEHTSGSVDVDPLPASVADESARDVIIQTIHHSRLNRTYACQIFPAVQPGDDAVIAYTATGGRFVDAHYWRQAVLFPTDEVRIRVVQHGVDRLTACSAVEERPDGSELTVSDSIVWTRQDGAMVIDVARPALAVNAALTLRWDFPRAAA